VNTSDTPETDAETMSDGVEMLTSQSDSVALYQKLCDAVCEIQSLRRERDEAREALMQIEDLFIDGTDIYADREKMGKIAIAALEGAK
jgi:hypothetical protein